REDDTHQLALWVGPRDRAAGATVAEGSIRGEIAERVPRRGRLQTPAEPPGMSRLPALVRDHGLHRGAAQNALAVIDAAVEEHLQKHAEVIHRAVHASPRMAEFSQVQTVRPVALHVFLGFGERVALDLSGVLQRSFPEAEAA